MKVFCLFIVDRSRCRDFPKRRASVSGAILARRVACVLINRDAAFLPLGVFRRNCHIIGEKQTQVPGKTFLELVLQIGGFGLHDIAIGLAQLHRAIGLEAVAILVIDNLGGHQDIGSIGNSHRARGGGELAFAFKRDAVRHHVDARSGYGFFQYWVDELFFDDGLGERSRQKHCGKAGTNQQRAAGNQSPHAQYRFSWNCRDHHVPSQITHNTLHFLNWFHARREAENSSNL